ncbi:MAG: hypothetical protein COS95_09240 [Ignavibacteriales bacterium CG07_land_8_20_14_0_80_59_12]|nr:MAG: hypothetical protein COS95_09240 [Ignavibacteriales bacterium CG07_land_8_20_14_0_80_59_12]
MVAPPKSKHAKILGDAARSYRELAPYMGLGTMLAGTIVFFFLIGRWVDAQFGTDPTFTIVGTVIGVIGGFYNFLRTVLALSKRQSARMKKDA